MTKVKKKSKLLSSTAGATIESRSLLQCFEADRVFWCNSNRGAAAPTDVYLEQQMCERGFAAAWLDFRYPVHMKKVKKDALIFMFAKRIGVIAVGFVPEDDTLEILGPRDPDRIRAFKYGRHKQEWRIKVDWVEWNVENPCKKISSLRPTFQEITTHSKRIQEVRKHFLSLRD